MGLPRYQKTLVDMETIFSNKLQEIKEQEQAVKEQKDFIRASFIAAIKETTHPSVKKDRQCFTYYFI